MQQIFSTGQLNEWQSDFGDNHTLPFVTTSALIELKDLEEFITKCKEQQADCVRVYFLRFKLNDIPTAKVLVDEKLAEGCKWQEASPEFTQATIAMVPAKNFKHDEKYIFSADDIVVENHLLTLMPGTDNQGTGLNPPGRSGIPAVKA
ncbi:hypothetical protein SAMN05518672_10735 [Chitinophaga sp. CF118]|uniref:hypothetical protein n=1 Tax=Chitinophaga sp. CF118 TaxID=1884367 RepID=UPI0008EAB2B4|nr:hypothetical protein [Chitinophaga sp. CF118]SFE50691.1 hypothetical protein SAMN05518672_10735 [Chitinophaga sp. CF118]